MMTIKFQNGDIRENGILIGKLRNNEIRNNMGTLIGKVKDGIVRSSIGTRIGNVKDYMIDGMQREKDVNMVAAYHFLVKKIF